MPPVGRGPACVNGKDRRSKRASLPAPARADAGPDPRARGAGAPPSPGSRSAHACGRPREARRRRPHFLSPNPPRPPRRPPPPGPRAHRPAPQAGGRSRPVPALAPRPDGARFLLQPLLGVRDARPRAHGTRRSPRSPHHAPTSPGYDETWPRLPGKEGAEGSPVERRSEYPAWSNRTRTPGRERGPEERGRTGEGSYREPPSRPPSPPGGPSRHRFLPGISFPAAARGKTRAAPAAPQGPVSRPGSPRLRPAVPPPPYPDTAPRELSPRGRVLLQPQPPGSRARLLPPGRFQIEIPWLGPSASSGRRPRPLAAEAPPAPPPDAPPARKPPRASPGPAPPRPRPRPRPRAGGLSRGIPWDRPPGTPAGGTSDPQRGAGSRLLRPVCKAFLRIPTVNALLSTFKTSFPKVNSLTKRLLNTYSVAGEARLWRRGNKDIWVPLSLEWKWSQKGH